MQSKRDQVQAHGFMMGRLSSGLLMADPDCPRDARWAGPRAASSSACW
ncbi:hypothetical protein GA0115253_1052810 [Streptomyces sp. Termitarium-T10T-6]|nr:hypothetical protein GA0115253_1052810 [Streptomyces sp. Termitarium-T10T-6]